MASVHDNWRATNDSLEDVEPSVITITKGGVDHTVSAYMKLVDRDAYTHRIKYVTTTNFSGTVATGELPVPLGWVSSVDPLLSENPYSGGVAAGRIYCTGLLIGPGTNPESAIVVWYSDDGGVNWTGPSTVAQNAGGTTWKLDKPSVAVSWYSGTLGHVYVAYMNIDDRFGATVHYLRLARSTDGGLCFGYRDQNGNCVRQSYDVAIDNVGTPFCVVSSATGYIYVWWTNHTNEEIRVGRSTDGGVNWNHEVVASGDLLGPSDPVIGDIFGKQTRAFTIPMGRYNSVAGKLVVVWHERESGTTAIYYSFKPCSSSCNPYGWRQKMRIDNATSGDQFMPAIDFDTTGNQVVTFYDRRNDLANNLLYEQFLAWIGHDGTIHANIRINDFQSDPTRHKNNFVGDYQDVWSWTFTSGERYVNSWIGIPDPDPLIDLGELYLSRINP